MNIWLHLGNQVMVHKTEYNFQRLKAKAEVWNRVWILEASSKNGCKKSPFWSKKGEDLENREAYSSWELLGNPAPAHSHGNKPFIFLQVTPADSAQV